MTAAVPTLRITDQPGKRAKPKRIRFNIQTIEGLKMEPGKDRLWVFDTDTPHLALMVTQNTKTFYWYGRRRNRPVRYRIGRFGEKTVDNARREARKITGDPDVDPNDAKRELRGATLAKIWERFLAEHVTNRLRPRTQTTYKDLWKYCLKPWASRVAAGLNETDVIDMHRSLTVSTGPVGANRAMAMLRRMLAWARVPSPIKPGVIEWNDERPRERHLSKGEMQQLMQAIRDTKHADIGDFLTVALFTGARRSNVLQMEWKEIDLTAARWQIPGSKAKARTPIVLHLAPNVVELLKRRRKAQSDGIQYVFPGPGNTGHAVEPKRAWTKIRKAAGITDVTLHDLRRTMASWMAQQGSSLLAIGKVLGHQSPDATRRYAHLLVDGVSDQVDTVATAMIEAGKAVEP